MSDLKNFRKEADEAMSDINVSRQLKSQTLERCKTKKSFKVNRILIPAVSFALILGMLNVFQIFPFGTQKPIENIPEKSSNSIMMTGKEMSWPIADMQGAKDKFGNIFLTPGYMPAGFKLDQISSSGPSEDNPTKIILSYTDGNSTYMIFEEKSWVDIDKAQYRNIDINGNVGFIKSDITESEGNVANSELHWFQGDVHYSVMGLISEDEALKIAKDMK